ncbi:MAG: hypothetical protein ABIA93_07460 [Candidatus Woesearchaeota archaeon]
MSFIPPEDRVEELHYRYLPMFREEMEDAGVEYANALDAIKAMRAYTRTVNRMIERGLVVSETDHSNQRKRLAMLHYELGNKILGLVTGAPVRFTITGLEERRKGTPWLTDGHGHANYVTARINEELGPRINRPSYERP